jgi:hypothetical protein
MLPRPTRSTTPAVLRRQYQTRSTKPAISNHMLNIPLAVRPLRRQQLYGGSAASNGAAAQCP